MSFASRCFALLSVVALLAACGTGSDPGATAAIRITPSAVEMSPGANQVFSATVTGLAEDDVTWSATGGLIRSSGLQVTYTAPETAGTYTISAALNSQPGISADATVSVSQADPLTVTLQVSPAAVTFAGPGESRQLSVQAFDPNGREVSTENLSFEWQNSDGTQVRITQDGSTVTTIESLTGLGSSIVSVRVSGRPETTSAPVAVSITDIRDDVLLLEDSRIVFPPPDLPPGDLPDNLAIAGLTVSAGQTYIGPFPAEEVLALFEVVGDRTLRYPVVLRGDAPSAGTPVLATGGSGIIGITLSALEREGYSLLQVEETPFDTVFNDYSFSFNSETLASQGVIEVAQLGGSSSDLQPMFLDLSGCKPSGGLLPDIFTLTNKFHITPIYELHFISASQPILKVGFGGEIAMDAGFELQPSISGTLTCTLPGKWELAFPALAGPLAAIVAPKATLQPEFRIVVTTQAGPRVEATLEMGVKGETYFGFDCTDGCVRIGDRDWKPIFKPSFTMSSSLNDAHVSLTPGVYGVADVGVQIGGFVLGTACRAASFVPGLGDICENIQKALFIEALKGEFGGELALAWDSPARVSSRQTSESEARLQLVANAKLEPDSLNVLLSRLGIAPIQLSLAELTLEGPTFYRPFEPDEITLTSQNYVGVTDPDDTYFVTPGETISLHVKSKYALAVGPLFDTSLQRGEVWLDGSSWLPEENVEVSAPTQLDVSFTINTEFCNTATDSAADLTLLGFNRIFEVIEAAGYVGSISLRCGTPYVSGTVSDLKPGRAWNVITYDLDQDRFVGEATPLVNGRFYLDHPTSQPLVRAPALAAGVTIQPLATRLALHTLIVFDDHNRNGRWDPGEEAHTLNDLGNTFPVFDDKRINLWYGDRSYSVTGTSQTTTGSGVNWNISSVGGWDLIRYGLDSSRSSVAVTSTDNLWNLELFMGQQLSGSDVGTLSLVGDGILGHLWKE